MIATVSTMSNVKAYLKQPTTINGVGAMFGVLVAVATSYMSGSVTAGAGVGVFVAGLVHVLMPDNSALSVDAGALAVAVAGLVAKQPGALSVVLSDAGKVAVDLVPTKDQAAAGMAASVVVEAAPAVEAVVKTL